MYQQFWTYAIFVIIALCAVHYLASNCMSKDFGVLMTFLGYLVIAYIVATSMRSTILFVQDDREKSVKLAFDCLAALYILVTGYCMYGGRLMGLPGRVIDTGVRGAKSLL
jgi:hypothetical protein